MLTEAIRRGIVSNVTDVVDEFFGDMNLRSKPFLEGEHWMDVAEQLIEVVCPYYIFDCCDPVRMIWMVEYFFPACFSLVN